MAMLARRSARIHAALAISRLFPDSKDPLVITHLVYNPADLSAGAHRDPGNREDKFSCYRLPNDSIEIKTQKTQAV